MQFDKNNQIFLHDITDFYFDSLEHEFYKIGYFIARHPEKTQQENEDTLFVVNKSGQLILGVADGAGGHPRGRDASFLIGSELSKQKVTNPLELICEVNQKIIDLKVGARSTLALCLIENETAQFHTVGDSEIIYWNAHGNEILSSTPHSSTGHKVRAGVTSQEESLHDPDRYIVNNLMGDDIIRVESTSKIQMKKGHTVIIGSDGLFDNISHEQLNDVVGKGEFDNCFSDIVQFCKEQDPKVWLKNDDIAFIVIRKVKA